VVPFYGAALILTRGVLMSILKLKDYDSNRRKFSNTVLSRLLLTSWEDKGYGRYFGKKGR